MLKEQWWSLFKVLVQRYQTGAGPAISAILSAALPERCVLARAAGELAKAHVELKGPEQLQRVEELVKELGPDKQHLSKVVGLLVARFDILIRELSEIQKMGVKGEALNSVARQKINESQNDIIQKAVADLQSVGPLLTQFDELGTYEQEEPTAFSSAQPVISSSAQPAQSPRLAPQATSSDEDLMHGPKSPEVGRQPQLTEQKSQEAIEEPQAGDVIGGQEWHLLSLLGKGGMGSVWKARNHFEEMGALKLMLPHLVSNERLIKRFQLEIRAIKKIRHPNVVALSDWGKDRFHGKEQWYFVTDFIQGKPLSRILQEDGALSMEQARDLFIPLAEGLHAAHAEGVVHRDIKPGNIMVRPDGSPVLIDFGIARQLADPSMTQVHERVLTLQFASPEQLYGEPVSPKSDVFSLAATLSFVLFPDPKRQRPQFEPDKMPEPYHWILETCLSYKPENRPEDMMAFVDLLQQLKFENGTVVSYPKRPAKTGTSDASIGMSPDQAFSPTASAEPASLSKEIYHYNGPAGQDKLPLDEIFEHIKADPKGRHLLWHKGWPNWQMWHKVPELKEYVQALKENHTQQPSSSAPSIQDISPFSKHTINIGGCQHTMIALPPGSFWMGNQNIDAESDEKPRHRVNLSRGFLLGQTQLTQDIYEVVEGFNPSQFKFPNHPVERVSWVDVAKWCNKLSEKQGLRPAYTVIEANGKSVISWNMKSDGYRLPTEAEWEYAARAASNFNYSGSNRPDEVAWFGASRRREGQRTYRVGQKQPNGWDFYDMSGNVWEWCWEDARGYQAGEATDPIGTTETNSRVCRGGSNYLDARQTRCSYRMRYDINYRSVFVGFRIARSLI